MIGVIAFNKVRLHSSPQFITDLECKENYVKHKTKVVGERGRRGR